MRPLGSLRCRRMQRMGVVILGSLLLAGCQGSQAGNPPTGSREAAGPSAAWTAGPARWITGGRIIVNLHGG